MKTYAKLVIPLMIVCGVFTVGINALLWLVITIQMFMPQATLPMRYYEFLHLPILSIFFPFVIALVCLPLALKAAFGHSNITWPTWHLVEDDDLHPHDQLKTA